MSVFCIQFQFSCELLVSEENQTEIDALYRALGAKWTKNSGIIRCTIASTRISLINHWVKWQMKHEQRWIRCGCGATKVSTRWIVHKFHNNNSVYNFYLKFVIRIENDQIVSDTASERWGWPYNVISRVWTVTV